MSSELDDVAKALFIGQIPNIWRKLAPDTLKSLGNWMLYFLRRFTQYTSWVRGAPGPRCGLDALRPPPEPSAGPGGVDRVPWKRPLTASVSVSFLLFVLCF